MCINTLHKWLMEELAFSKIYSFRYCFLFRKKKKRQIHK